LGHGFFFPSLLVELAPLQTSSRPSNQPRLDDPVLGRIKIPASSLGERVRLPFRKVLKMGYNVAALGTVFKKAARRAENSHSLEPVAQKVVP
jgi:hypothetical protein